jgi:predicted AlkP superfamily pyrophosphatase or phosphodiesterase
LPTSCEAKSFLARRGLSPAWRRLGAAIGILAIGLVAATARPGEAPPPSLVILSLDGLRHDDPQRVAGGAFSRLAREGASAVRMEPPFPASTFPAHATLATGCYPERHGILNSRFRDARRGEFDRSNDPEWIACEPLWVTAEKQGVRAGVLNWVGSFGRWRGRAASYHDPAFTPRTDRVTIEGVVRWLGLPAPLRPRLILAYLEGVDHTAHRDGPDSARARQRVVVEDRLLASFIARIGSLPGGAGVNLIVVSDHGMAVRNSALDPGTALARAGIPGRTWSSGGSANVYLRRKEDLPRAARVLAGLPGLEVYRSGAIPGDLHYDFPGRTGDLVLIAPVGAELGSDSFPEKLGGIHGYRGTEPSMGAVFFGWGPAFGPGNRVEGIRAVDVYSLACRILGIAPSGSEQGGVPPGILRTPGKPRARGDQTGTCGRCGREPAGGSGRAG